MSAASSGKEGDGTVTIAVTNISAACHCGNLRLDIGWPGPADGIKVRNCSCSFCVKHGGAWTSHPDARLRITINDAGALTRYRFGTKTADFLLCQTCGVVPAVVCEMEGSLYAVVNVNTFSNLDTCELEQSSTDFDGENTGSRLERRRKNWIGTVSIAENR